MNKIMKNLSRILTLSLVFVFTIQSYALGMQNPVLIDSVQVNTLKSEVGDGYFYEKGIAILPNQSDYQEIGYEEEKIGDITTLKLTYGDVVEEAVYSDNSDIFTVSINGIKETFNKNDYLIKIDLNNVSRSSSGDPSDYGINVGTNYSAKELMRKNFTFNYETKIARLLEDYSWEKDSFTIFDFPAGTYISVIATTLALSISTIIAAIASLVTVVNNVQIVKEAITGEAFQIKQYWNKYGKIYTESPTYYHSGRTLRIKCLNIENTDSYSTQVLQDSSSGDFYNNTSIMQSIINAYIAVNS